MNRQIRWIGVVLMVLFLVLFGQLNYIQVLRADAISNNPLNGQRIVREFNQPRGSIVSIDGTTLAQSVPTPNQQFTQLREYPTGPLFADVTGFFSFTYGAEGAERSYDQILTGANSKASLPTNLGELKGVLKNLISDSGRAQSITLTLSDKLQQAAANALGGRTGSVVAIDPMTGAILAMYSNPSYDPNLLSQHDQTKVEAAYKNLVAAPGNPLSPAPYRQRWFPGSTFKMITSAAVYDHEPALANKQFPVMSSLALPDTTNVLRNFGGESCGGALLQLFTVSCNTGFGAIGLELGAQSLATEATAFGFNKTPPIDLPFAAQSHFPPAQSFVDNLPTLAYAAIGQESVQATPLQMAMVAGAFDDGGTIMTPHVLANVTDNQAKVIDTYEPKPWLQATSTATASSMTKLMLSVVSSPNGTGTAAQIPGVQVAAKTGTAETGTGKIDAWFACFIPGSPIAVAVLVPDQPNGDQYQGGTIAAPIAKAVLEAYLAAATTPTAPPTTTPSGP